MSQTSSPLISSLLLYQLSLYTLHHLGSITLDICSEISLYDSIVCHRKTKLQARHIQQYNSQSKVLKNLQWLQEVSAPNTWTQLKNNNMYSNFGPQFLASVFFLNMYNNWGSCWEHTCTMTHYAEASVEMLQNTTSVLIKMSELVKTGSWQQTNGLLLCLFWFLSVQSKLVVILFSRHLGFFPHCNKNRLQQLHWHVHLVWKLTLNPTFFCAFLTI